MRLNHRRRGGVLLHRNRNGTPRHAAAHAVPSRPDSSPARGPRVPASAGEQLQAADQVGAHQHPPVSVQGVEALAEAPQPQDAGVAEEAPRREQEVPEDVRHGAQRTVVHAV